MAMPTSILCLRVALRTLSIRTSRMRTSTSTFAKIAEEAIEHVRVKYGRELVSQIITYGKLAARAAIKDVARVLGVNSALPMKIAFCSRKTGTVNDALQDQKLLSFMDTDPLVRRVIQMALRVEGMTRQTGIHAAGVVIADRPLVEHGPLYRESRRRTRHSIRHEVLRRHRLDQV